MQGQHRPKAVLQIHIQGLIPAQQGQITAHHQGQAVAGVIQVIPDQVILPILAAGVHPAIPGQVIHLVPAVEATDLRHLQVAGAQVVLAVQDRAPVLDLPVQAQEEDRFKHYTINILNYSENETYQYNNILIFSIS